MIQKIGHQIRGQNMTQTTNLTKYNLGILLNDFANIVEENLDTLLSENTETTQDVNIITLSCLVTLFSILNQSKKHGHSAISYPMSLQEKERFISLDIVRKNSQQLGRYLEEEIQSLLRCQGDRTVLVFPTYKRLQRILTKLEKKSAILMGVSE